MPSCVSSRTTDHHLKLGSTILAVVCFGMTMAGCQVLPGHWRLGWNKPWPADKPVTETAASWKLAKSATDDGRFVALGISGGGSRAANFGAAAMLELQQRGLLKQVDVISGVSGGALPAAYYGLGDQAGAFTEPALRETLGYDFQSSWIRRWFLPHNIFRYWLSDFTRSDIMVQVFNNALYHEATFADLRRHPRILLNATVHNDHTRFTFTDDRFAQLHSVLAQYELANAVNASASFPGVFQDVTLQSYSIPTQYLHLYDGGPIDNLGVQAIIEYLNRNILGTTLDRLFPKGCLIVVIDATPTSEHPDLNSAPSSRRSIFDYFIDTNALDATDTMLMEARRTLLERMGIPVGLQDRQLRGRVPVNDLHRCSCEVRHVSLRHLQYGRDSEEDQNFAERVTEIKTKFWIGKDEQDDLYRAVRVVMKKLDEQRLFAEESLKPQCMSEETDGH
jgi:NTE family protein